MPLFEKGNRANPNGRPIGDPIMNKIRTMTSDELLDMTNLLVNGTISEVERIAEDSDSHALRSVIASAIVKMKKRGDMQALDTLLNRLVGKVKDRVEVSGELLSNEQVRRIVELLKSDTEKTSTGPALLGSSTERIIE